MGISPASWHDLAGNTNASLFSDPPSQVAELEDLEVEVGSSGWLKCSSTGNPRPQYVWNYYQTDNVMEENDDGVSRLMINNATALNTGSYTCRAWNDRGNASKTVRVHVKGGVMASKEWSWDAALDMAAAGQNGNTRADAKILSILVFTLELIYLL